MTEIPACVHYPSQQLAYIDQGAVEYRFGPWRIWFDPPPIPVRICDWKYWHDEDDAAPDGSTGRSGTEHSLAACLREIEEMLDDMAYDCPCSAPTLGDCMGTECPLRFKLEAAQSTTLSRAI